TTAPQLAADVGEAASTPVHIQLFPDPAGDKLAVVVDPLTSRDMPAGIAVLDRNGILLAALRPTLGPIGYTRPAWSPDGRSLAFPTYGPSGGGIAVWTPGDGRPQDRAVPDRAISYGTCLWAPDASAVLCPTDNGYEKGSRWVIGLADGGPLYAVRAPGRPLAWLTSGHGRRICPVPPGTPPHDRVVACGT
ncbi:MAG: hypothetical protein ACRDWW_01165, partial [Acidimicrobiales bacterium]